MCGGRRIMGFSGFKTGKKHKAVNSKFNKTTNKKQEQVQENEVKEHLKFMVAVGLLEETDGRYKEPEICNTFSKEQRKFILSVSEKSYDYALALTNVEGGQND